MLTYTLDGLTQSWRMLTGIRFHPSFGTLVDACTICLSTCIHLQLFTIFVNLLFVFPVSWCSMLGSTPNSPTLQCAIYCVWTTAVLRFVPAAEKTSSSFLLAATIWYTRITPPRILRSCEFQSLVTFVWQCVYCLMIYCRCRYACEPRSSLVFLQVPLESIPNAPDGFEHRLINFVLSIASSSFRDSKVCASKSWVDHRFSPSVLREWSVP